MPYDIEDIVSMRIFPGSKYLLPGGSQQCAVYGAWDDGHEEDITSSITSWESSGPAIAPVSFSGLVKALTIGRTAIKASLGDLSATALFVVQVVLPQANGKIIAFASRPDVYRSFEYKTKRYQFRKQSISVIMVVAEHYPVDVDIVYPDIFRTQSVRVTSEKPQRVKSFLVESCEVTIRGNSQVSAIFLASSMGELPL
jgi:hypothetical protein